MPRRPPVFDPQGGRTRKPAAEQRLTSRERGYDSRWDRESKAFRRLHPLCEYCLEGAFDEVRTSASTRVDHLYPQRRFPGVFWLAQWWVASCDACDAAKQALEHGPQALLDALAARMGRPVMVNADVDQGQGGV